MSFLISLSGDIFAFIIIWRGFKLYRKRHEKMFETEGDYKTRKTTALFIILIGLIAIFVNHVLLGRLF